MNDINNLFQPLPLGNYTLEIGQLVRKNYNLFDFEYPFYDPDHKKEFEKKFLLHFRYHEIGCESIERFKYMLQDLLVTEYPRYKHYYDTWLIAKDLQWQYNKDYTEENKRVLDSTDNSNSNNTNISDNSTSTWSQTDDITDTTSKFSDTPQGEVTNIDTYITNATVDRTEDVTTSNIDGSDHSEGTTNTNSQRIGHDVETNTSKQYGNIGVTTSADLVTSWNKMAKQFNIDKMIFDDCEDLFMQIY